MGEFPSFRQIVRQDIRTSFFNDPQGIFCDPDDKHTVNGREMDVVVDTLELTERRQDRHGESFDGLYKGNIMIYVPAAQFGPKPAVGDLLVLDGRAHYRVVDATNEDGVYSIELGAWKS
ncbi:MAG: hypothetical protein FWE08_06155 [Oscillospiraceae bacterium]|nr:hypothetical protein [Oscillospiraceae bacterium]